MAARAVLFLAFISIGLCRSANLEKKAENIAEKSLLKYDEVCPEGFEYSVEQRSCLPCRNGYYRTASMETCAKCSEPTSVYERMLCNCTINRNSIIVCKNDIDAADGSCTASSAVVEADCDKIIDPLHKSTARKSEMTSTSLTTPPHTSLQTATTSHTVRPFSATIESLSSRVVYSARSHGISSASTTASEYDGKEYGGDYSEKWFAIAYPFIVMMTVGAMSVPLFLY